MSKRITLSCVGTQRSRWFTNSDWSANWIVSERISSPLQNMSYTQTDKKSGKKKLNWCRSPQMWYHIPHKERYKLIIYLVGDNQEPITRSLRTNCTLESTLSCILLFLELRYVGGSLISRENMLTFAHTLKKIVNFPRFCHYWNTFVWPACNVNNREPQLSYDWLLYKQPRKAPWEVLFKIKRYGTGLTQRVSMKDGSSGQWVPGTTLSYCKFTCLWQIVK